LPDATPSGTQGFFLNTRRAQFKDVRVRKALDYAFDFEWMNKVLFYGLYQRTLSYFQNSDMMAEGAPGPGELKLLDPFRDRLSPEVFGPAYVSPVTNGSGNNRENLRRAHALLAEAGYVVKDGRLMGPDGRPFVIEFVDDDPGMARIVQPYIENLKQLGIQANAVLIDPAQFERRRKAFDFDVVMVRYSQRLTPGLELRERYGAREAATEGTSNYSGVADPAADAMIEAALGAKSRTELVTAVRALDRVLRAGHYWVPHWYKAVHHIAYWDKFGRPQVQPRYQRGILDTWWAKP
jgi:microcin C transport system substrate-binding protein